MTLAGLFDSHGGVIRVALARVRGSSPRNEGTEMFVAPEALHGTIGGGQLEHRAIETARAMLHDGELARHTDVPLGPEIGQCCGGRVELSLTRMRGSDKRAALERAEMEAAALPHVYVMGAGHVGRAIATMLQHLPVRCIVVDPRAAEVALCTVAVETRVSAIPELDIATAPPGSAFIVLTHDHGLDFLLTSAALERGDAAYVGMIGSATKRVKLRNWMRKHHDATCFERLTCPIGAGGSRDKRPGLIAAFVVAEIMAELTRDAAANGAAQAGHALARGHHHDQEGATAR
ncbi:xanthine dehydrogenase accessory factor [Palleronia marisminoris]|uniref:XdhC and CoxI family protein n=1 Tax=Palleronia marisminoris TaxID=315423 RepID=A0A1Y5SQI5_9RHOB|nr:xanthine dehydrogenase accessory protein XdhC [Palleronia marisminoris]SFG93377.1 xanthine dehydrogenase accessory factor [Palleronia marisminoris]SLN45618.1 XdhC and CoxI family protein [Palleronia marisminoris]